MTTAFLPGVIILPARNDDRLGVAKRARDDDLLTLLEETDARGWSSSVPERSLALRRRRAPASSSCPPSCGWVTFAAANATAEEHGCRREEAATPDPDVVVGTGAAAEETAVADPCFFAYDSTRDSAVFEPPPMASPLLPLCAFITDFVKAREHDRAARQARDRDLPTLSEEVDARGWSSSDVPERSLAPRRRRGPAYSSTGRG